MRGYRSQAEHMFSSRLAPDVTRAASAIPRGRQFADSHVVAACLAFQCQAYCIFLAGGAASACILIIHYTANIASIFHERTVSWVLRAMDLPSLIGMVSTLAEVRQARQRQAGSFHAEDAAAAGFMDELHGLSHTKDLGT